MVLWHADIRQLSRSDSIFAGSSSVLAFEPGSRPTVMAALGRGEEGIFVYEHRLDGSTREHSDAHANAID